MGGHSLMFNSEPEDLGLTGVRDILHAQIRVVIFMADRFNFVARSSMHLRLLLFLVDDLLP